MMTTSSEVLYAKLTRFAAYLRKQGMQMGLSEVQDCFRVLQMTGFENREWVRSALCSICAKTRREQEVFGQCFDLFFVDEEQFKRNEEADREAERLYQEQRQKAEEELMFNGKPIDLREDLKEVYARMAQTERDKLQHIAEAYSDNTKRSANLYEGFIRSIFMRSLLEQQMMMENAAEGSSGASADADLMLRDISSFRPEEIPKAYQLIDRLTARINGEVSARKRKSGRSDVLNFKKTIHAGMPTGGVLCKLTYKRKRNKKKHMILLCDVSGSMLQFSEFAIRFIKSMSDVSDHSETFLFSEQIQKVSPFTLENMNTFGSYVRHSRVWGKGTNIGFAIESLCAIKPSILNASSILLILSDAKSVDLNRAEQALIRASKLTGTVIWLNPIPENRWKYLRGVTTMQQHCCMLPCSTLNELARACARFL